MNEQSSRSDLEKLQGFEAQELTFIGGQTASEYDANGAPYESTADQSTISNQCHVDATSREHLITMYNDETIDADPPTHQEPPSNQTGGAVHSMATPDPKASSPPAVPFFVYVHAQPWHGDGTRQTMITQPITRRRFVIQPAPKVPDYLFLSFIVCLFCSLPLGCCALAMAKQAKELAAQGDYEAAMYKANGAREHIIASLIFGIFWFCFFLFVFKVLVLK